MSSDNILDNNQPQSDKVENALIQGKMGSLTQPPGAYLIKNSRSRILYVGIAKSLRNPVRSYFQKSNWRTSPRVPALGTPD